MSRIGKNRSSVDHTFYQQRFKIAVCLWIEVDRSHIKPTRKPTKTYKDGQIKISITAHLRIERSPFTASYRPIRVSFIFNLIYNLRKGPLTQVMHGRRDFDPAGSCSNRIDRIISHTYDVNRCNNIKTRRLCYDQWPVSALETLGHSHTSRFMIKNITITDAIYLLVHVRCVLHTIGVIVNLLFTSRVVVDDCRNLLFVCRKRYRRVLTTSYEIE